VDFKKLARFVASRAKERSTWQGLVAVAAVFGVAIGPDQMEALVALAVAVAGAIQVFWPDDKGPAKPA